MDMMIQLFPFPEELNQLDSIPLMLTEWENIKIDLSKQFQHRNQINTLIQMKKGIGLFIQILFWSNDITVKLIEPFPWDELVFKPINLEERLGFIISRPQLFHSFRQLSELILEQEKLFAKINILKKASKLNG